MVTARPWPDPDAQRRDADPGAGRGELVGDGAGEPGAGAAERVADRDGAAVRVDELGVEVVPLGEAGQRLGREGLVELHRGDVGLATGRPWRSARFTASTGPIPKNCGSTASTPVAVIRASGSTPSSATPSSSASSRAAAPSESCEALPAVTVPSSRNDGLSLASDSSGDAGADALVARQLRAGHLHDRCVVRTRRPRPARPGAGERTANASACLAGDAVLLAEQLGALAEAHGPLARACSG